MPTVLVENITVHSGDDGNIYLVVYPDQIVVDSKDLISMIENKKDCLVIGDYMVIQIQDILAAVHNLTAFQSSPNFTQNKPPQFSYFNTSDPKRPTNAFILFNNTFRKRIKSLFPNYTNSEISKFIGAMWKAVAKDVKEDYINQAIECRRLHKIKYPNFEYNLGRTNAQHNSINPQDIVSDDWEKYFNWCIQNTTTEATSGALYCDTYPQVQFTNYENNIGFAQDYNIVLPSNQQDMADWTDVCNVISQFFPEESNQANYIDEQLWDVLNNFTASL